MKCKNCKHIINSKEQEFCPECGVELVVKSRKTIVIILFSIIALLFISVVSMYFIGKANSNPDKVIENFEELVYKQDADALMNLLTTSDKSLTINEENIKLLVEYFDDHPDQFNNVIQKLKNQAEQSDLFNNNVAATLNLIKEGKKWLLFDDYKIEIIPGYIEISSSAENIDLLINEEKVATTNTNSFSELFGPYMPGTYTVTGLFDNSYVQILEEEKVTLFNTSDQKVHHSIQLSIEEVEVFSPENDLPLYINGEESDIILKEGKQSIGKFPTDASVILHISRKYPWGEFESEKIPLNGSTVSFDPIRALNEETIHDIMVKLNGTISQYQNALSVKDASLFQDSITDNMKTSFNKHLEEIKKERPNYEGQLVKAIYDQVRMSNPEFDEQSKAYTMTLRAHYTFREPNGNLGWLFRDTDNNEFTRSKELTVLYDEENNEWLLEDYATEYFVISSSDEKVFNLNE